MELDELTSRQILDRIYGIINEEDNWKKKEHLIEEDQNFINGK
jgi:hypothetical protein